MDLAGPRTRSSNGDHVERQAPKLRRSCEVCRATKGRCIPSRDDENRCQRCTSHGKQCLFLSPKPRPKRAKNSRIRVAEMEEKLDSLLAMISKNGAQSSTPLSSTPVDPVSHVMTPIDTTTTTTTTTTPQMFTPASPDPRPRRQSNKTIQFGNAAFPTLTSPSYALFDGFCDVISRGIISCEQAEESIRYFQSTAASFPFVIIPAHTTLEYLRQERPFLLLAVLAMAAQSNLKLQSWLEQELRDSMSKRIILNGEKSIDLMQGLIIYLSWYHCFFNPERQQVYQLSQLVISMAIDLGITIPSGKPLTEASAKMFSVEEAILHNREKRKSVRQPDSEKRRAFLGAYYLSSALCISLRKPNSLKYSNYIDDCCQVLATANEEESDGLIPYFIQIQRLAEDVNRTFDIDGHDQLSSMDSVRILLFVKIFVQQLAQMEITFPPEVWNNAILCMSFYGLRAYVHEVGFHASPLSPLELLSNEANSTSWYSSLSRNDVLISCLNAAKAYMDRYLSLPLQELRCFTLLDHLRLIYIFLILGRFTTSIAEDAPSLDAEETRKSANMEYYQNALVIKLEGLLSYSPDGQVQFDYIMLLTKFFRSSKAWLPGLKVSCTPPILDGTCIDFSNMSFHQVLPALLSCRVGLSVDEKQLSQDEMWTDIMESWPTNPDSYDNSINIPLYQ